MNKILVTGAAGFIGFHLSQRLAEVGYSVVGIDNLNDYYDVNLKKDRLSHLNGIENFKFLNISLQNQQAMSQLFRSDKFQVVINLAAQPGVRYSIKNPYSYVDSNVIGFLNVLEGCRHHGVKHLIFASSSSVYGANTQMPFSVHHNVDHPVSLYAATKKANELMAHSYASLYKIPCTGLRFFTVYGPWGRPDMAYFSFTKSIFENKPIDIYNDGKLLRDFTYIKDIIESIVRLVERTPQPNKKWNSNTPDPATSYAPYKIYNIGNNSPVGLMTFIGILENYIGKKAVKNFLPMQAGDVHATYADIDDLISDTGYKPITSIEDGIKQFIEWYKEYYKL